jgi:YegS/Rv2252/BmrU family lipid kinase
MIVLDYAHSSYRRAAVIYNPYAGRLARRAHLLQRSIELLRQQGTQASLVPTTGPGTAGLLTKREIDHGADLIVAAGGDGTINEVVNGMAHSLASLAILPGGTANVLAHELGIKHGLLHAAGSIASLKPCRISLGVMRAAGYERYFLLMAGVGLDAQIVYDLNLDLKAAAGKLAYYAGGMAQLLRPIPQFDVTVSGKLYRCGFALISNVRNYGGDLEIARGASLLRDDFEIVLFEGAGSLGYLRYLLGVAFKRVESVRGCTVLRAKSAVCEAGSDPAIYTQIDGELACRLPVTIEIEPKALTLLIPPAYLAREQRAAVEAQKAEGHELNG